MNRILLTTVSLMVLSGTTYANDYKQDYIEKPAEDIVTQDSTITQSVKKSVSGATNTVVDTTKNAVQKTKKLIMPPAMDMSAEQQEDVLLTPPNQQPAPAAPAQSQDNVVRIRPTQASLQTTNNNAPITATPQPILDTNVPAMPVPTQVNGVTQPIVITDSLQAEKEKPDLPIIENDIPAPPPVIAPTPAPVQQTPSVEKNVSVASNDLCTTGTMQSPVNIAAFRPDKDLTPVEMNYTLFPLKVTNTGKTVEVTAPAGNSVRVNGQSYALKHVHFHTPSDHYFKGVPYAMEAHFIHQGENGRYLAIAVPIKVGKDNPTLQAIWQNIPAGAGAVKSSTQAVNIGNLFPQDQKYYTYQGSLTMPPCPENVTWIVMQNPIDIGQDQLKAFQALYPSNARELQDLNGRVIKGMQ